MYINTLQVIKLIYFYLLLSKTYSLYTYFLFVCLLKGLLRVLSKDAGVREDTLSLETDCHLLSLLKPWTRAYLASSVSSLSQSSARVCCSTPIWQQDSPTYKYPLLIYNAFVIFLDKKVCESRRILSSNWNGKGLAGFIQLWLPIHSWTVPVS